MKLILFLLILALLLCAWLFPTAIPVLSIVFVTLSLALAFAVIFRKHRVAYQHGRLTGKRFAWNVLLEVVGTLLAVTLAILLAGYIAGIVTRPISADPWRLTVMILIGLLVGLGMGLLVNRAWGRLIKTTYGG